MWLRKGKQYASITPADNTNWYNEAFDYRDAGFIIEFTEYSVNIYWPEYLTLA